jgi:carbonic anhydrase
MGATGHSLAADHAGSNAAPAAAAQATPPEKAETPDPASGQDNISRLKAVIARHGAKGGSVSLRVGGHVIASTDSHSATPAAEVAHGSADHKPAPAKVAPRASRNHARVRAAVLNGHAAPEAHAPSIEPNHTLHWSHEGEGGPQNWAQLQPEFSTCATGKRQSPVHIRDADSFPGPAEALLFDYRASGGSVVNNGHTVQVDPMGHNTLRVRGSVYQLVQFHFHHPAEERVNDKGFAMVAHLVHKNEAGQLAVVAVLIDPGAPNPLMEQVWTHMPLDVNDRVGLPADLIDVNQMLPADQRYYQFFGSLTTPPCTEGVLWLVMKQPMTASQEQIDLFAHIYPMNARPSQALNGRLIREAK